MVQYVLIKLDAVFSFSPVTVPKNIAPGPEPLEILIQYPNLPNYFFNLL